MLTAYLLEPYGEKQADSRLMRWCPLTSALLSLIVIPAAFTLVDDLGEWMSRRFRHRSSHSAAG